MFTPITFPSALIFWLKFDGKQKVTPLDHHFMPDTDPKRLHEFAARNGIKRPLHIFVPTQECRHRGANLIAHVLPNGVPEGSFVSVSGIPIVSPELCFLLASKHLSVAELSVLATDLCATYALNQMAAFKQITRKAISSVQRISDYLSRVRRVDGIQNAKRAILYALDGSHSPMESKLSVIASLPLMYGGFAIERPELNSLANLTSDGVSHFKYDECCCDLIWEKQKVIVEYDSDLVHSTANQVRKDKKKATALSLSRYKVITATKDHFLNVRTVEGLFFEIRKVLGMRNRAKSFEASQEKRRSLIIRLFLMNPALDWLEWAEALNGVSK